MMYGPMSGHLYEHTLKMVIVGDAAVGKTRMVQRYLNENVGYRPSPTLKSDVFSHSTVVQGKLVKLYAWDTAGEERYRCTSKVYYRGVTGAMVVYDVTNRESFEHVGHWLKELEDCATEEDIVIILVGNKSDLEERRAVTMEEGMQFADTVGIHHFMETSSLNATSVHAAFKFMLEEMVEIETQKKSKPPDPGSSGRAWNICGCRIRFPCAAPQNSESQKRRCDCCPCSYL